MVLTVWYSNHLSQCFEHKQLSAFPTTKASPHHNPCILPLYLWPDSFDQMRHAGVMFGITTNEWTVIKEAPRGNQFCPACSWKFHCFVYLYSLHNYAHNIIRILLQFQFLQLLYCVCISIHCVCTQKNENFTAFVHFIHGGVSHWNDRIIASYLEVARHCSMFF